MRRRLVTVKMYPETRDLFIKPLLKTTSEITKTNVTTPKLLDRILRSPKVTSLTIQEAKLKKYRGF